MIILSQRDQTWAGDTIGNTSLKIGKLGCTITCVSMLSDYYKCFITPGGLAKKLSFNEEAKLIWSSINKVLCFNFVWRGYGVDYTKIDAALKDPETSVILEVEHFHWIVALRKIPFTNTYWCADPIHGDKCLSTRYKYISGYATFKKK